MNNKEYISSEYDNNNHHIEEEEDNSNLKQSQAWGTWEELLLACAVKRHGFGDWDSIAKEVRSRTSLPPLLASPNNCRQKYRDLKRRFQESGEKSETVVATEMEVEEEEEKVPWLEQLRSLRVAELRREVQQYDVSILSLQLKVKKLEEEREQKPDLEDETKRNQSENNDSEPTKSNREKAVSPEESDRENRSINESNSTGSVVKTEERIATDEPSQARDKPDPDPVNKAATEEVSISRGSEVSHSGELGESGTSGGLGKKWRRKGGKRNRSKDNHGGNGGEIRSAASKSQPLINVLELIRSHPRGSLFESRLRSQDTKDYKSLVKEHLDIDTIHRKLEQGSYNSSRLTLYRDLQLLFTNAITFFPFSSPESMAAHELRSLVFDEMRKETGKSGPNLLHRETLVRLRTTDATNSTKPDAETSDSSLSRQKSSATLVVCKKRNSASTPSSSSLSQKEETREEISEEKENIVTGVRSSRRSNKPVAAAAANNTKTGKAKSKQKQTEFKTNSSDDNNNSKQESAKTEKKIVSSEKKKSVADFLKRIEKNSPKKEDQNKSRGTSKKESKSKPRELRSNTVSKKKAEVESTPLKRSAGRPQKKTTESPAAAATTTSASGKRGRETGSSTGKDNKQPKKRSRR